MIDKVKIKDKLFLDNEGILWTPYGVAGTGEYSWWCRNVETDEVMTFPTEIVIEKISSYEKDLANLNHKEEIESKMFNMVKKISEQILRKEILNKEQWSDDDLSILYELTKGRFNIIKH